MLYSAKKDFDAQKAIRFFKERRIPCTEVDLKKHKPGKREIALFIRAAGSARELVDRKSTRVLSHPVAYTDDENVIIEYFMEDPTLMRLPIIRNGDRVTLGADEAKWKEWIEKEAIR